MPNSSVCSFICWFNLFSSFFTKSIDRGEKYLITIVQVKKKRCWYQAQGSRRKLGCWWSQEERKMWLSDVYLTYFILNCYGGSSSGGELHACDRYSPKDFFCTMCNHERDFLPTSHCRIFVRVVIAANQKPRLVIIFYRQGMVILCCFDFEGFFDSVFLFKIFISLIFFLLSSQNSWSSGWGDIQKGNNTLSYEMIFISFLLCYSWWF